MKKSLSTICLLIALLAAMGQVRADFLYSGSRDDNLLHVIDPSDASTLDAITLSLAGGGHSGNTRTGRSSGAGILWALLDLEDQTFHELVTIDPVTGAVTDIGTIDSSNSALGLAFAAAGTLYRIDVDANLVTLSPADASSTFVKTLTDVAFRNLIAFNPLDGMMYHRSGALLREAGSGNHGADHHLGTHPRQPLWVHLFICGRGFPSGGFQYLLQPHSSRRGDLHRINGPFFGRAGLLFAGATLCVAARFFVWDRF